MPTSDPFTVRPAEVDYLNGEVPPPHIFAAQATLDRYAPEDVVFMYESFQTLGIYTDETLNYFLALNNVVAYTYGQRLIRPAGVPPYDFYYCRTCRKSHGREHFEQLAALAGIPFVPSDLA